MGVSASKQREVVCVDCDKKTQKDLPADHSSSASKGSPCEEPYARVAACMDANKGQVSLCVEEWDAFKDCHARYSRT